MIIDGITIEQRIQPNTISGSIYPVGKGHRTGYVKLEIGIIPSDDSNRFTRLPLWVPWTSLLQNRAAYDARTVRFNHFMNVLRSLAKHAYNVQHDETVVFLNFTNEWREHRPTPIA